MKTLLIVAAIVVALILIWGVWALLWSVRNWRVQERLDRYTR